MLLKSKNQNFLIGCIIDYNPAIKQEILIGRTKKKSYKFANFHSLILKSEFLLCTFFKNADSKYEKWNSAKSDFRSLLLGYKCCMLGTDLLKIRWINPNTKIRT